MTTMKELERKINELDKRTDDKCDKYFDNADRLGRVESVLTVMTIFLIVAVAASLVALAHDTPSLPSGHEEVCVEWKNVQSYTIYPHQQIMLYLSEDEHVSGCFVPAGQLLAPLPKSGTTPVINDRDDAVTCYVETCTAYVWRKEAKP